jgi:acetyl esterase/lipase
MVICPGGGYGHLAPHEGEGYARWLNRHGVAAFVLKYRLATDGYHDPAMFQDATRAVRLVRSRAADWNVDPRRVGIMGSSAGGHLAASVLVHGGPGAAEAGDPVDRETARPDLGILCYPVITMGPFGHQGSKENLLGASPAPGREDWASLERHVTAATPPTFVWHTVADAGVQVENSLLFAQALRAEGVPFDLHLYQEGGHGMGLGSHAVNAGEPHPWAADCLYWLREHGFVG